MGDQGEVSGKGGRDPTAVTEKFADQASAKQVQYLAWAPGGETLIDHPEGLEHLLVTS
jgi:hypothetical protein